MTCGHPQARGHRAGRGTEAAVIRMSAPTFPAGRLAPADRQPRLPVAFGPVRSRRLGWSLGINNVPPKTCTYACAYCQVGATDHARLERAAYLSRDEVVGPVAARLAECRAVGQPVDHATFVPDGEPTLDVHLGDAIRAVAALGVPTAVLTNGSLLWREDVRAELASADVVSIKVDTIDEAAWRRLNRPIGRLRLEAVLDGMRTSTFVSALGPLRAYVAIPTRPPAEPWVRAPSVEGARRAAEIFRASDVPTACLVEELEAPFAASDDAATGLLGIVAVHPMTRADARDYLARSGADWSVAQALIDEGRIVAIRHGGRTYLRAARAARPDPITEVTR